MNRLISVIVPIYNGRQYINKLFDNFSKQSYTNFELVLIDDGSTDGTSELIKDEREKHKLKIYFYSQKNKGVSSARNLGILKAKGDYICFCDVDDCYDTLYIESLLAPFLNNDIDVSVCDLRNVFYNHDQNKKCISTNCTRIHYIDNFSFYKMFLFFKVVPVHCCLMIRRTFLIDNKLFFSEGYNYGEDYDFSWRTLLNTSKKVAYIKEPLYNYIWRENSAMSVFDKQRFDAINCYTVLEKYVDKRVPDFYPIFKKYWISRALWSIARQAANKMGYLQFKDFFSNYNMRGHMCNLVTYRDWKVIFSALMFCMSPYLFYKLSRIIDCKIH